MLVDLYMGNLTLPCILYVRRAPFDMTHKEVRLLLGFLQKGSGLTTWPGLIVIAVLLLLGPSKSSCLLSAQCDWHKKNHPVPSK